MIDLSLLLLSLFGLWAGTEIFLKAVIGFSSQLKVSQFFIGLTLVALGTDLPELVIGINSSLKSLNGVETSGLIVGNALGSAFNQISIILGLAGLYGYLTIPKRVLKWDGLILVFSVVLVFLLGFDGTITRLEASLLIFSYLLYFYYLCRREFVVDKNPEQKSGNLLLYSLYFIGGSSVIWITCQLVTEYSLSFVESWGVSQSLIGIIIIGLGTSLPELAVSLSAISKGSSQISAGNLIGSNIFDMVFVLGASAAISPLKVDSDLIKDDFPILMALSLIVIFFFKRKKGIQKIEAIILINIYLIYSFLKIGGQV